jgi:arylsulfatase A-like enzyme/Flp pilus assembly protein TadD
MSLRVRSPQTRRWPLAALVVTLIASGLPGCRSSRPDPDEALPPAITAQPGAATGFNVVLFTLDTLRADHLGCYGYEAAETPHLDTIAAGGVRFSDAVTAFPVTLPAHCTIMTGKYPPAHGVRDNGTYRLISQHQTLAERLQAAGYATAAVIGAFVLDRRYGLDQGFDVYDDKITMQYRIRGEPEPANPQRPANVVVDAAIRWLEAHRSQRAGRPFFLWIHLFDPHTPYTPPEPFQTRYAANPYDGEVAFTDQQVGRFLAALRQRELLDRTLVVAVGDHGEGLGDHGELEHGLLIYGATMRVPLIFHAPAIIPPGRVVDDRVVGTVDIAPTILDLLGLDPIECDGSSLVRSTSTADRVLYLETLYPKLRRGWSPLHGLRRHNDKYILAPTPEYYDLRTDPGEIRNLADDRPSAANALAARLREVMSAFPVEDPTSDARVTPDAEALEKLAALGYVGSEAPLGSGPLPDPKQMVLRWQPKLHALRQLVQQARFDEAIPLLEDAIDATPADPELWLLLSEVQARMSRFAEAAASRLKAIELQGGHSADDWVQLARLQQATGDLEAAEVSLSKAEKLEPDHGEIALLRAQRALDSGRYEDALRHCDQARRRDPTRCTARSWSLQGRVYEQMGQLTKAKAAFEQAHQADRVSAAARLNLAEIAFREGHFARVVELSEPIGHGDARWAEARTLAARAAARLGEGDQAIGMMRELVQAEPADVAARNNLGCILQELGRLDEAAACFERAIKLEPGYATAHLNLALVLKARSETDAAISHLRKALDLQPDLEEAACELAGTLGERGQVNEALQIIERLLAAKPRWGPAYLRAATVLTGSGQPARAIDFLRRGYRRLPDDPGIANHLAWLRATSPDETLRDGARAVELAERANELTGGQYSGVLDTLAAAYAAASRFDEAVATAERALELARRASDPELAAEIELRLSLYRRQQAYYQP